MNSSFSLHSSSGYAEFSRARTRPKLGGIDKSKGLKPYFSFQREIDLLQTTREAIEEVIQENVLKTLSNRETRLQIIAHKLLDESQDPDVSPESQQLLHYAFLLVCEAIQSIESGPRSE